MTPDLVDSAKQAWGAWLGFYNGAQKKMRWNPRQLVSVSGDFAASLGLQTLPGLPKRTLHKMGLYVSPYTCVSCSLRR